MLKKKMDKRCLDIINHYGPDHQKRIFSGEADELRDAITEVELRDQDYLCERHEDMLIDEIADVLVMLGQFIQYYDLPIDKIDKRIDFKLDRQEERIRNEGIHQARVLGPVQREL